jgi:UPF0755 protein
MSETDPPLPFEPPVPFDPKDQVPEGEGEGAGEGEPAREGGGEREGEPGSRAERRRRGSHRVRRRRRAVVRGILGAIVVIVLGVVFWFELQSHALGPPGKAEIVPISSGETVSSVATQLSDQRVIGSTLAFRLYNVVHSSPSLSPGSYLFHQNLTFAQVHTILDGGPNVSTVRVDAGLTLHEVAIRVGQLPGHTAGKFEQAALNGSVTSTLSPAGSHNLEGLLGTGTYQVLPGETDTALLRKMVDTFEGQAAAAGLSSHSAAALGLTPYQVVTVASVVEKEGYYPKNMPKVARVIYNRLAHQTPLQMDSTILYALGQDGGTVTPQDLKIQNPYNTYLNGGLPPTPICMSSLIALSAAVHPPPGGWLYFVVVDKSGTEAFADTFPEQLANEQLAQSRGVG